jgi:hypothetical protein
MVFLDIIQKEPDHILNFILLDTLRNAYRFICRNLTIGIRPITIVIILVIRKTNRIMTTIVINRRRESKAILTKTL